ncbi:MAG: hypothetical protein IJT94_10640, partial [Oscillibacter sp.]|nr:hypothetical protein [Oscillibacter sp.]
ASARDRAREMAGCVMEAEVSCDWEGNPWTALLRCAYIPGERSVVQALSPETVRGVQVLLEPDRDGERVSLRYAGKYLDAGAVSREAVFPAACLPRLMDVLRDGWLLEENFENFGEVPCARLALDQTGEAGKIDAVLWLRREDGTPVRGEIAVDGETVLTAEFTSFVFYDTLEELRTLTGE